MKLKIFQKVNGAYVVEYVVLVPSPAFGILLSWFLASLSNPLFPLAPPVVTIKCSLYADSTWGRFFHNAELERMVDQDLSRLYPEHGNYFQTKGCQGILRRILLLWCLRHPECGYRQGKFLSQATVTHNMFTFLLNTFAHFGMVFTFPSNSVSNRA